MDKYFEIRNANQHVIVDDQFKVSKFLYRSKFITTDTPRNASWQADGMDFRYVTFHTVKDFVYDFSTLGFNAGSSWEDFARNTMLFARSSSQKAFRAQVRAIKYGGKDYYRIEVLAYSNEKSFEVEFCLYTLDDMKPCSFGAQAFNRDGKLIFDAMRGYLQVVGSMYGGVDALKNPAAIYRMPIPNGLNMENVFISHRSAMPFYSAYSIGSGGVSYNETYFYPVMRVEGGNILEVRLVRQNDGVGNNSKTVYNNYYENVIYCPYPSGVWITGD